MNFDLFQRFGQLYLKILLSLFEAWSLKLLHQFCSLYVETLRCVTTLTLPQCFQGHPRS